jgi:hypothetical protein
MYATAPTTQTMIEDFADALQKKIAAEYAEKKYINPPMIVTMRGPKYTRLVTHVLGGNQRSCYGFIENATGLLLKSAGWKNPAKHACGTLHTPTGGIEFAGPYGFAYLC